MGLLRVHFTAEDLMRTHVAAATDPLWEVILSHFLLHERTRPVYFRPWLHQLRADQSRWVAMQPAVRMLTGLAPQGAYFPDFLTPAEAASGLDAGLDAVASTPRQRLRRELDLLAKHSRRRPPTWTGAIAAADNTALRQLTSALRSYHQAAIAPHDELITASLDADRAHRAQAMLTGGLDGLFDSLRPLVRWQSPVLEVRYDVDHEIHLNGRGLRLVPSFFCHGSPVSIADSELSPVLIYPISHERRWTSAATTVALRPLARLMGTTRATILLTIAQGATTTGLARALNTSLASASRHTAVLRDAGLITTYRRGPSVLHTLTPLGTRLLETHPTTGETH
jgi:DNA-binding transcriptional ArsR family regulator